MIALATRNNSRLHYSLNRASNRLVEAVSSATAQLLVGHCSEYCCLRPIAELGENLGTTENQDQSADNAKKNQVVAVSRRLPFCAS